MSTISWQRFAKNDRRFDEEVLGGWIRAEDVEAFSKDLFESVEVPGLWVWRLVSTISWQRFAKNDRRFEEEVLGGWI